MDNIKHIYELSYLKNNQELMDIAQHTYESSYQKNFQCKLELLLSIEKHNVDYIIKHNIQGILGKLLRISLLNCLKKYFKNQQGIDLHISKLNYHHRYLPLKDKLQHIIELINLQNRQLDNQIFHLLTLHILVLRDFHNYQYLMGTKLHKYEYQDFHSILDLLNI